MAKSRGYPDRRGMGAQSDFISETFVPSAEHQREQIKRARALIASGLPLADVAKLLSVSSEWLRNEIDAALCTD
jgi:hypothetical protein